MRNLHFMWKISTEKNFGKIEKKIFEIFFAIFFQTFLVIFFRKKATEGSQKASVFLMSFFVEKEHVPYCINLLQKVPNIFSGFAI